MKAELEGDQIVLSLGSRDTAVVKALPGTRYDRRTDRWHLPVSWLGCLSLRGAFGDRLEVGPALRQWAVDTRRERVDPTRAARTSPDAPGREEMYPYQRQGVAFLKAASSAMLGDEMGTGKTFQTIQTLADLKAFPALVVCPKSVKPVWAAEFARWAPEVRVAVCGSTQKSRVEAIRSGADVVVINWDVVPKHSRLAPYGSVRLSDKEKEEKELNEVEWVSVVADEAHRMIEPKNKWTRAVWWLGHRAMFRFPLTGTPIQDAPDDLWSVLHFVDPLEFPSRVKFIDRYCAVGWSPFGNLEVVGLRPDTRSEFLEAFDLRFLRRTKKEVLQWLPEKVYSTRYVQLPPALRKPYREMEEGMLTEDGLAAYDPLVQWVRLTQMSCAKAEVVGEELTEDGRVKQEVGLSEPSPKLDAMMECLEDLGPSRPLVVFSDSRKLLELAERRLEKNDVRYGSVKGGQNETDRREVVASFQRGDLRVLLMTSAGAEGLTLTAADTLLVLKRPASSITNRQLEDRVHRPGAEVHEVVTIVDVIAEDTCEHRLHTKIEGKYERADEVLRDRERLQELINNHKEKSK